MKTQMRWWVLAVALVGTLWLVGCGQKQSDSSAPPAASQQPTAQQSAPAGGSAEHGESGEKVTPAGTAQEIWGQIVVELDKLSAAIQNGELKNVHHLAFATRDLAAALAEKATASSPALGPKLQPMVEQVKASASKLDELGDAGNLSGTQAEFARFSSMLDGIRTVTAIK